VIDAHFQQPNRTNHSGQVGCELGLFVVNRKVEYSAIPAAPLLSRSIALRIAGGRGAPGDAFWASAKPSAPANKQI
jgi:hypothetical protein